MFSGRQITRQIFSLRSIVNNTQVRTKVKHAFPKGKSLTEYIPISRVPTKPTGTKIYMSKFTGTPGRNVKSAAHISHQAIEDQEAEGKPNMKEKTVNITFVDHLGNRKTVPGHVGRSLYQVGVEQGIYWDEPHYCRGTQCCVACHVVLSQDSVNKVAESTIHEDTVVQYANQWTPNSRLACAIIIDEDCEGLTVTIPKKSRAVTREAFSRIS